MSGAALRRLALAGSLAGALAGCASTEAPTASRPTLDAALARLPAEAAGFQRGETSDVSPGDAGAGKVVEYATARRIAVAHVFVYDLNRPSVTEADLPPEVERAVAEGTTLPQDRTGRRLAERSRTPVSARGGPLTCSTLGGTFGRNPVERHVCVGVAGGRFLRVQVTMPSRSPPVADAEAFATAVATAVRG
ncbi:hypothetical protein [Muricoccus radiodurans]|uniref:hypothetical protein n=1 Tax=Muricoccus radiodurans TaxID=2231721 RepID=UPI003CF4758A